MIVYTVSGQVEEKKDAFHTLGDGERTESCSAPLPWLREEVALGTGSTPSKLEE